MVGFYAPSRRPTPKPHPTAKNLLALTGVNRARPSFDTKPGGSHDCVSNGFQRGVLYVHGIPEFGADAVRCGHLDAAWKTGLETNSEPIFSRH
jgi:hypothetical protein